MYAARYESSLRALSEACTWRVDMPAAPSCLTTAGGIGFRAADGGAGGANEGDVGKVKEAGKYKTEGKEDVVEDGDIIFFKFNVTTDKKK